MKFYPPYLDNNIIYVSAGEWCHVVVLKNNMALLKYDLWKTCRTCLKSSKPEESQFSSFFKCNNPSSELPTCIMDELAIMKIKISPDDGLPHQICIDCTHRLKEFHTFRVKSKRSQEILEQYFNKLKSSDEVIELENENSEMYGIYTNFEFIDPNVKQELFIDEDNKCYDNIGATNFVDCYNIINNKEKVVMDSFGQNCSEIENSSTQCLNYTIDTNKLQKKPISISYENQNTINENNTNRDDNRCISAFEVNNYEDYDIIRKNQERDKNIMIANQILKTDAKMKVQKDNLKLGKFRTVVDRPLSTRHTKKIPKCRYCKEDFNNINELEEHVKNEHPIDRPHLCPICRKGFKKASNRTAHLDTHITEYNFKCDECKNSYKSEVALKTHKRQKHLIGEYRCPYCPKNFRVKGLFVLHLKKKHISASSTTPLQSIPQQKITMISKTFKCQLCEKAFVTCAQLRDHERTHTGERPYLCNVCGKAFTIYSSLVYHFQIHENKRKYKCHICDKGFNLRATLNTHVPTHSNLQPFQCEICGTKYKRKSFLTSHMKRKHSSQSLLTSSKITTITTTSDCNR